MNAIEIVDVGPRDGLQNATVHLSPAERAQLVSGLLAAGIPRVEAVSFVHPELVPAMAGAEEVIATLTGAERDRCCALVLNERGYDRFTAFPVGAVRFTLAVSDAFQLRNARMTRDQGLRQATAVIRRARDDGVRVGAVLATSFGCPFSGDVAIGEVLGIAAELVSAGAQEIVLADTIGVAVPRQVRELVGAASALEATLGIHVHNTRNTGYASTLAAIDSGATLVEASLGGLGGCPFSPGASGNIATEDLVWMLEREGYSTGIDLPSLLQLGAWLDSRGLALDAAMQRAGTYEPAPA